MTRLGHKYLLVPDWNSLVQRAQSHQQELVEAAREQFAVGPHENMCAFFRSRMVVELVIRPMTMCECMSCDHHMTIM